MFNSNNITFMSADLSNTEVELQNTVIDLSCNNSNIDDNDTITEASTDNINVSIHSMNANSSQKIHYDGIHIGPSKYSYHEIDKYLSMAFNSEDNTNYSAVCDIIAIYLKGQKILYTESKTICEQRLTYLMLPAIFLTVVCSILSLILQHINYGNIVVSGLGGITTFILALINYLKLDARAESFRISAYKFDKLQSFVEFNSGKLLFVQVEDNHELIDVILKVEDAVSEIKGSNQFVLPEIVRFTYPNLYSMNIFSEVKKIQYKEMVCKNNIKDYTNKIQVILFENPVLTANLKLEITIMEASIHALTNTYINMKNDYLLLDHIFDKEITANRESVMKHYPIYSCDCFKV